MQKRDQLKRQELEETRAKNRRGVEQLDRGERVPAERRSGPSADATGPQVVVPLALAFVPWIARLGG